MDFQKKYGKILLPLIKRQQGSFAGGAGDDEGVAEVVRDDVLDQLGILAIVDLFVFVIGGDRKSVV